MEGAHHVMPMLDSIPLWAMFLAASAIILLALEMGYRAGQWRQRRVSDEKEAPVGAMVASILGLLAFMLGFTFSLAASRFEERRKTILEEGNAIGTTYLRAKLLPQPESNEVAELLRKYVAVRVYDPSKMDLNEAVSRSEQLHASLWSLGVSAAAKNSDSIMTGLFLQSLNELIDLHAKRVLVGVRSRIPLVIWIVLYLLAILGLSAVGYQSGLSVTRRSPAMIGLACAFAGVMVLIADLDSSHEGLLKVSQQALIDTQKSMQIPAQK